MAEFPEKEFSNREIKWASKLLSGKVYRSPDAIEAFKIAHNWRMAHLYPLVRERIRLTNQVKNTNGGITSGRIKQMSSIRKKLRRGTTDLRSMQDLAGFRAVLDDVASVNQVLNYYRGQHQHRIFRETDYILNPKKDGYRSAHIILKFDEGGMGRNYSGQRIELQVRTRLQHAWATAVEAVGFVRQEDLKAGLGDQNWLRLFSLMSAYLSKIEGLPLGEHVPMSERERREELAEIVNYLGAIENLETYHYFMEIAERQFDNSGGYYQLSLNTDTQKLSVEPRWKFEFSEAMHDVSFDDEVERQDVVVNVDDLSGLKAAFPNYYYDVRVFLDHLKDAVKDPVSSKMSLGAIDLSFLKGWRNRGK